MGAHASRQACDGAEGVAMDAASELVADAPGGEPRQHIEVRQSLLSEDGIYTVEVRGPEGHVELSAQRKVSDFERAGLELRRLFAEAPAPAPVPLSPGARAGASATKVGRCLPPSPRPRAALDSTALSLQRWINEVASHGPMLRSPPLQGLLGAPGAAAWAAAQAAAGQAGHAAGAAACSGLTIIAECHQPLLFEIAGFLADSPRHLTAFAAQGSRTVASQMQFAMRHLWRELYTARWPAFADCLAFQGAEDWRAMYKDTLMGRCECTLEVFDREKKLGFAMAAMPARVQYEARVRGYVARYLSATEVQPETIPYHEGYRLRFCPSSARQRLQPGHRGAAGSDSRMGVGIGSVPKSPVGPGGAAMTPPYPYRVFEGIEGLQVGQGVELQWRMQFGSPFGWWYGQLEELHKDPSGKWANATITFRHFPASSRWYKLDVRFGDSELRPCSFGGFTGGIRGVSEEERALWMRFFPKEPVIF